MGLLDLPSPALLWIDARLASFIPSSARIFVWGGVGAALSMGLYWFFSPQQRMARIALEERRIRIALSDENTEIAEGLASAARLLRLAATRIALLLPSVLVAAIPLVCLTAWLDRQYGRDLPAPGQTVAVTVDPRPFQGRWIAADGAPPSVEVVDERGSVLHSLSISAPVPIIRKRVLWNAVLGNPLGYLPDDSSVERIQLGLPKKQYLIVGPNWVRCWEAPFMAALLIGSVLLKLLFLIR
jgi:hypothetical protein